MLVLVGLLRLISVEIAQYFCLKADIESVERLLTQRVAKNNEYDGYRHWIDGITFTFVVCLDVCAFIATKARRA